MSRHGLLRSTPPNAASPAKLTKRKRRCGEVVGGATAECTAVVCCCPFAAMDMLVLALYKAPRGMCRKLIDKRKRKKKNLLLKQRAANDVVCYKRGEEEAEREVVVGKCAAEDTVAMEAVDLEMYDKFYGTGFWRSSSQRSSCS